MSAKSLYWKTIGFAPAPPGWQLRRLDDADASPRTVPIAGWLTQEQVDDQGKLTGVAAVRVIAGYHRPFSDAAPAQKQEDDEGYMAAEVVEADDPGWHVYWNGQPGT